MRLKVSPLLRYRLMVVDQEDFVFCNRELNHALFIKDYFSKRTMFGLVKFHR